jgi:hypothetical protein
VLWVDLGEDRDDLVGRCSLRLLFVLLFVESLAKLSSLRAHAAFLRNHNLFRFQYRLPVRANFDGGSLDLLSFVWVELIIMETTIKK